MADTAAVEETEAQVADAPGSTLEAGLVARARAVQFTVSFHTIACAAIRMTDALDTTDCRFFIVAV